MAVRRSGTAPEAQRSSAAEAPYQGRRPHSLRPLALALAAAGLTLAGQLYLALRTSILDGALLTLAGLACFWYALGRVAPSRVAMTRPAEASSRPAGPAGLAAHPILFLGTWTWLLAGSPLVHPFVVALLAGVAWIGLTARLEGWRRRCPEPVLSHVEGPVLSHVEGPVEGDGLGSLRGGLANLLQGLSRGELLALAAALALAAGLRFYGLDRLPEGLWYDEAAIGLEAQRVVADSSYRPVYASSTTSPAAYLYLVAGAEALLSKTEAAVRAVPAGAGLATVALGYLVGRSLWGPWAGLAAAGLFAAARWDLTFSRFGLQGATTPLLTLLACLLVLLSVSTGRLTAYGALGVALGLLPWFYAANVFFFGVLGMFLLAMTRARRGFLRAHGVGLVLAAGGALLVMAPVLLHAAREPAVAFGRTQQVSIFKDKDPPEAVSALGETLAKHLLMFNLQGDANGRHNLPQAPMLDPATGAAMLLGLVAALRRWREPLSAFLLSWLLLMLLPGVLSVEFEAPQALRSIGALPAALLLAVWGLERLHALVAPYLSRAIAIVGGAAGLMVVVALNAGVYFGPQAADYASWSAHSGAESRVGRYLAEARSREERVLVSELYGNHPSIDFVAGYAYEVLRAPEHIPLRRDVDTTLFLAPQERTLFHLLRQLYPEADCREERRQPVGPALLYRCSIASGTLRAGRGLLARFATPGADGGIVPQEKVVPWAAVREEDVQQGGAIRGELRGSLHAPLSGRYGFILEGPSAVTARLDDRLLLAGGEQVSVELAQGLHELWIGLDGDPAPAGSQLLWQPPGGAWSPIPREALYHGSVRPLGLTGSYHAGALWSGQPAHRRIEPSPYTYFHLLPLERPFTVEWQGSLYVSTAGVYQFQAEAIGSVSLELDGQPVVRAGRSGERQEGSVTLSQGWRSIRVRYLADAPYSQVYLQWRRQGEDYQPLSPEVLRPW
ncbi:MAG: hypothetical protein HYY02_08020 [Chloroflexi bacterium]|nr:hypothetical protein [Chloroflexota bacterium]